MSAMYFAFTGRVLNLYGYLISEIRDNPAACLFTCLLGWLVGWLVGSQVFVRVVQRDGFCFLKSCRISLA